MVIKMFKLKLAISKNFLISLLFIVLIFGIFCINVDGIYASDNNQTDDGFKLDKNTQDKLKNSQINNLKENTHDDILKANGGTFQTIRDKIQSTPDGGTLVLDGIYTASNSDDVIVVNKPITITSNSPTILNGMGISQIFKFKSKAAGSTISNLKFINGYAVKGGAILIEGKDITVSKCIFEENKVSYVGGAVASSYNTTTPSNALIQDCQFIKNSATISAGALALFGDNSKVINCIFDSNYATNDFGNDSYGGAIQIGMDGSQSRCQVIDSTFINNWAFSNSLFHSHGGAGCVRNGVEYTGCKFINNSAGEGGALTFHASGVIDNCIFINNTARDYGGALSTGFLYTGAMKLRILNSDFDGNSAPYGGAIQLAGENIYVENSKFNKNFASINGGAVNIAATTVELFNNNFNNNWANVDGGAVYIKGRNTKIHQSSFISNSAIPDVNKYDDGLGGAIYVNSTNAEVLNNEFKLNTARNGSAIYYDKYGVKLILKNNIMSQNQAWVYWLPINAKNIYFGDNQNISSLIYGGNNIAKYNNLDISNAIYNAASHEAIEIDGVTPIKGATDDGRLYQDDREYNMDIILTVVYEDGSIIYNKTLVSSYLGEVDVLLSNLKPGTYYVRATHIEDTYYKGITNTTSFIVYPKVDNQIKISSDKLIYNFDDLVVWTINITNNGPNNATDVVISEIIPKGLIYFSDTSGGLYDGQNHQFNISKLDVGQVITFKIFTITCGTGEIVNNVNISSPQFDTNLENNYDEAMIFVNPAADLEVVKTVNITSPNYLDIINWTIVVRNNGPDISHNITVSDILPSSLIPINFTRGYDFKRGIWEIESLEVGEEIIFNIICMVNATGLIENNVYVKGAEYDYDLYNNHDDELIRVNPACDLAIIKLVNSSNVNYHDYVKWTLIILNNGPDNATDVNITDILPKGFTYINSTLPYVNDVITVENLAVGELINIDIICFVETTGNYTNFANVTCNEYDYNMSNNKDNESIVVNPAADLIVEKEVNNTEPKFGDYVIWKITITNDGPDVAHSIVVYDVLPKSLIYLEDDSFGMYNYTTGIWNISRLDIGETAVLNIKSKVNKTGVIVNYVNVTAKEYDYNLDNNYDNETIVVEPAADVVIIKLVNNTNPNYNDLIKWNVIVFNNGPDKANNVSVSEIMPEGLIIINLTSTKGLYGNNFWFLCCLENGEVQSLEIICRVNKTGNMTNYVVVRSDEYDPNIDNNDDNKTIQIPPAVDVEVIVNVNNTRPHFADTILWQITVKNNGPDNATSVKLSDIIPDSLIFVDYDASVGNYSNGLWDIGILNVGRVEYLNITCIANAVGRIIDSANASALEYDWNMSNNKDSDEINVLPVTDLAIEKIVNNNSPNYNDLIKWSLIVTNNGPNDASNVRVMDMIPHGLRFIKSSDDENYKNGLWKVGDLSNGQTKQLDIFCKVVSTGLITNFANVWSDDYDPDLDNNQDNKSITVAPASDLAITKIASKYNYVVGDIIKYTIRVVNNGPDTAYNIKIKEILDKSLILKSVKPSKGKFNRLTQTWEIDSLEFGESAVLIVYAIAKQGGIVKNVVKVSSDNYDYDLSNNKDYAIVNIAKSGKNIKITKKDNKLNEEIPKNVVKIHNTANPIVMLIFSLLFCGIFVCSGFSNKR